MLQALADAMFSLESPTFDGTELFPNEMKQGYGVWNSSGAMNKRCRAKYGQ